MTRIARLVLLIGALCVLAGYWQFAVGLAAGWFQDDVIRMIRAGLAPIRKARSWPDDRS